jgi:myo-inositol-1(or 4)-monophosphatase
MKDFDPMRLRMLAAEAVAREAGALARRRFLDSSFKITFKGPQDFLTEVDSETEELIKSRLSQAFPNDGFIGEETAGRPAPEGEAVWVVDPIDGTVNFARGVAHFCVSIACLLDGVIEVAAIYDPVRDELFAARRGGGAFLNGAPIRPSGATSLANTTIEIGWNVRSGVSKLLDLCRRIVSCGGSPFRLGSGALGVAYVAAGRRDGYVENHIWPWDCMAAILVVRESGGYVSNYLAGDGLTKGNPLIACAPGVKDALISAVEIEGIVL